MILAAAIILILLFIRFVFPGALPALVSPLFMFGNTVTERAPDARLSEENAELRNENEALKARLRDVGADERIPTEAGVLAGVLARPPLSPYDTFLLSKGKDAGIQEGAIVFAEGVPVGSIVEADTGFSRALLYSAPGNRVEGWLGEARTPVTLLGEGAGAFTLRVPRELPVVEGDTVYLPGPGAFPAGVVRVIERHASSPETEVRVEPLVNVFSVTYVRILP